VRRHDDAPRSTPPPPSPPRGCGRRRAPEPDTLQRLRRPGEVSQGDDPKR
jgi:hypothetical protein